MSERKESSVLFSLRELQTIEEERVSEEAQSAIRAAEEVRLAKEAEAQSIRDAEEARRQAAELAERQAREEVERRQREEQLRLEEVERRARVDAQALIEQQRLAKEMELKIMETKRKKPAWIIAAIGVALLVGGLLVVFKMQADSREEQAKKDAALAVEMADLKKAEKARKVAIDQSQAALDEQLEILKNAHDEETRNAALAAIGAEKQRLSDLRVANAKAREAAGKKAAAAKKAKKRADKKKFNKCVNSSDPLCGL